MVQQMAMGHQIHDPLVKAGFDHDEGERMRALAMNANDKQSRATLFWKAECYDLLCSDPR
jgi:hypothetical protein